jgi:hypothetical protein
MSQILIGTASWTDKSLLDSGLFYPHLRSFLLPNKAIVENIPGRILNPMIPALSCGLVPSQLYLSRRRATMRFDGRSRQALISPERHVLEFSKSRRSVERRVGCFFHAVIVWARQEREPRSTGTPAFLVRDQGSARGR